MNQNFNKDLGNIPLERKRFPVECLWKRPYHKDPRFRDRMLDRKRVLVCLAPTAGEYYEFGTVEAK